MAHRTSFPFCVNLITHILRDYLKQTILPDDRIKQEMNHVRCMRMRE
jgi:hypothetical protein